MKKLALGLLSMALLSAQLFGANIVITVDEFGNGNLVNPTSGTFVLSSSLSPDPGSGGLSSALTYNLLNPPGLVAGDLVLLEPISNAVVTDVLRFNSSNGTLVFYSDVAEVADSLADKGFPTASYTNSVSSAEVGLEGNNGFTYTPTNSQPGFVAGAAFPVTYVFISDSSSVPEPASISLMYLGAVALGLRRRSRAKLVQGLKSAYRR